MSLTNEFEHDGALFTLSPGRDEDHITMTCAVGGRTLWSRSVQVLEGASRHGLMFRHRWLVRDGQLLLETDGEHWRGATSHDQRWYRVDRRGIERLPSP